MPLFWLGACLALQERGQGVKLIVGELVEGRHNRARRVGAWILEVADKPLVASSARALDCQFRAYLSAFTGELMTSHASLLAIERASIADDFGLRLWRNGLFLACCCANVRLLGKGANEVNDLPGVLFGHNRLPRGHAGEPDSVLGDP